MVRITKEKHKLGIISTVNFALLTEQRMGQRAKKSRESQENIFQ